MTRLVLLILVSLPLFLPLGCTMVGDDPYGTLDDQSPFVIETFPAQDWIQVPRRIQLLVLFSEAIDPDSVGLSSLLLYSGDHFHLCRYHVQLTEEGLGRVIIEPRQDLLSGVRYHLEIGQGIRDLYGNGLAHDLVVDFTTVR